MKRNKVGFSNGFDRVDSQIGGKDLGCLDDFFAEMSNLMQSPDAIFIPDTYTDIGMVAFDHVMLCINLDVGVSLMWIYGRPVEEG